jgi:hypothetical protein
MPSQTLVEVAIEKAPKQKVMIDLLTEESPFLARMPMEPCSDDNINKFEQITDIESAKVVELDEPLPVVESNTEIKDTTLSRIGGIIRVKKNKIDIWPGDKNDYYAKKLTPVLRESGNELEQTLLYNTFMKAAEDAGRVIDCGGDTVGKQNSVLVIKWGEGETNGLFNPKLANSGKMFGIHDINGGNLYELHNDVTNKNDLLYGRFIESFIGAQVAKVRNVYVLKNVDLTIVNDDYKFMFTEIQMNQALDEVRANPANTEIWCCSAVSSAAGIDFSGSSVNTMPVTEERRNILRMWNEIPILTSYNFKQNAEAVYVAP